MAVASSISGTPKLYFGMGTDDDYRLVVITGAITIVSSLAFWLVAELPGRLRTQAAVTRVMFPDSPTTAWFLTHEERVIAIQRLKVSNKSHGLLVGVSSLPGQVNQTGVENKHFKKEQCVPRKCRPFKLTEQC